MTPRAEATVGRITLCYRCGVYVEGVEARCPTPGCEHEPQVFVPRADYEKVKQERDELAARLRRHES